MAAMMAASTSLKAQEVTITLSPGWTWISCPVPDTIDFTTALGDFTPMQGDVIKSLWGQSTYINGQWRGSLSQFYPGYGYHYKSNREMPVTITIGQPLPQLSVTTAEPTDINASSALVGGTVTIGEGNHVFLCGVCWGTEENPTIDGDHIVGDAVVGSQSFTLDGLTPSTTYYVRAYAVTDYGLAYGEEQSFTTEQHAYVDLGLPSGLLWATCNVGAENPEDYGDYFAWGETQPKDAYDWSTYQYCNGTYYEFDGYDFYELPFLTKYCSNSSYGYNGFTDNLTTLLSEDDAATENWGSEWRMPTEAEWQELFNNTTNTWTSQGGWLFTASNGNSLFLPAAGYRNGSSGFYGGHCGGYWSSLLNIGCPSDAWFISFGYYGGLSEIDDGGYCRCYGRSVRPVRSGFRINATPNLAEGGTVSGSGTYLEGAECTLTATPSEGWRFVNWMENGEVVSTETTYTFTVTGGRILVANFTDNHAYVDLGLPSGLLWATCNVGADNPEDYGDYFAWGETEPKNKYNWSTYQYCMGSNTTMNKYCNNSSYGYNGFTDDLTTLLPEDDAVKANWGNEWRMPTKEEWQELYNNTTNIWTTQNGVDGRLFTAANVNSLFLPAAGYRNNSSLSENGVAGDYLSRSLYTNIPNRAWEFNFLENKYGISSYGHRQVGLSVRAVRNLPVVTVSVNPPEGGTVSGGGTYAEGATCTLTATPSEFWSFVNWMEDGVVVSTDATFIFGVMGDRTLVANFQIQSFNITASALPTMGGTVSGGGTYDYGQDCTLTATANENSTFVNWTENGEVVSTEATYTFTVTGYRSLVANFTINGHDYVDLGLPSGTLWATCNVGADNPEDYGGYFYWYDDVATANWGIPWRLPTSAEWQELLDNTTNTWTTQKGVNGRLFIASNGNSIFLPAAGVSWEGFGSHGFYWSSWGGWDEFGECFYPDNLYFNSDDCYMSSLTLSDISSVRPVRSGQK